MKKTYLISAMGALAAFCALSDVQAEERWPRWYLGLSGGYTHMQDEDVSGSTGASKISLKDGYGLGGSIGYLPSSASPLLNVLRFEAEVTYHENKVDNATVSGVKVPGSGQYSSTAYMANVFYDFPTASAWSPYVGGGLGMATLHLPGGSGAGNTSDSDNEFAYQALVGIGYSPDSIPNTQWSLGYRYLGTSDPKFGSTPGNVDTKYSTHSIEAGAKFRF